MEAVLKELKEIAIISPTEVIALQEDLKKQYPDYTNLQRAQLFAKAIHQRLDTILRPFDAELQKQIKFTLLRKSVQQTNFSINALDIINTYHHLEATTCNPPVLTEEPLMHWLNQNYHKSLSASDINTLTTLLSQEATSSTLPIPTHLKMPLIPSKKVWQEKLYQTLENMNHYWQQMGHLQKIFISVSLIVFLTSCALLQASHHYTLTLEQLANYPVTPSISLEMGRAANHLQDHLQYKSVQEDALKGYLKTRHSLLAEEPYFHAILDAAKEFNVNPLLLFAITGQEQGFVPQSHANALQIANNPFNLYGSWEVYNTTIQEAARIAARTVINLGKNCPSDADQIAWINRSYAADPNWHLGVSYFLDELEAATSMP